MAEAAVLQKIKKDILPCYICSAELKDPIGLPCLHGFCFECLETWHQDSQDKTQVICPACKKSAPVPKEGIRGFPGHRNLQETMDKKPAEARKETSCQVCGKTAEAHCIDCKKPLCQQCITNHNEFIKDHHIVTIKELQSGQITTEGRVCEVHGEQVRYYCETEDKQVCVDCVSLNTCQTGHKRVTIKEAAKKQADLIDGLMKKCADIMKKFQDAIKNTNVVLGTLNDSKKQTKTEVENCRQQYIDQVNQVFDKVVLNIDKIHEDRVKDIENKKKVLKSEIDKLEEAEKQASDLTASNSDLLITYKYSSVSTKLNEMFLAEPVEANESLGYLAFESLPMAVPPTGYLLQRERWRLIDQFPLSGMKKPSGIALNQDGDIAVTSFEKGVKVFSRDGQVKCSFMDDCTKILSVAVSNDNRYVVDSGANSKGIQFYPSEGNHLSSATVTDTFNRKSCIQSIAIDAKDRIIVGLTNNTISIHYADGSLISKFVTKSTPTCLAATSEGTLVCSFYGKGSLELMDYSGSNVKVVQPPPEVKKWNTFYVCCRQGEIFVVNPAGDPAGIFRYTSKGHYLGCITTEVKNPRGIALSQDGMELFVVERDDCKVNIFHRE
ncbi:E3 ubiquitin-protein ligase TRIM45-like [Amphiura filiformis]|uniref:E3 ubiquitin-protein ligase TRIM45-like n=1 Tax=Amphiura filiformis TaxID=82378 RepID=UPI003B20DE05